MVAIFTGAGTGFERGSGSVLGGMGLLGQSSLGRGGEQVMLNAANGNLLISQRDEFLVGRGPDAAISRTYNSLGNFSDDNGDNWRQSTHQRLVWHTVGSVLKRDTGDGSELLYAWDGSAFVSKDGDGAYDKITRIDGGWRWTDGNSQTTEIYADAPTEARLVERSDTSGNKLTFSYSGDKLTQITTADGSWIQYHWAGNNLAQLHTGFTDVTTGAFRTQTRTRYGYDHLNRLTAVTVDLSEDDNRQGADGYTTNYGYHGDSKLVAFIAQTDGSRMDFGYDGAGRVTHMTQTVGDAPARTTTIGYGGGYTHISDPSGQVTALEYNADGSLRTIIAPPAQWGAASQIVRFGYNGNGDLTTVTDAAGATTTYAYDDRGNAVSETDRLGNVVRRTYGARNQLLTETRVAADWEYGQKEHTTRFVYDTANRLRFEVSAEGNVLGYGYNGYGQVQWTVEYPGARYNVRHMESWRTISEADILEWDRTRGDRSTNRIIQTLYDVRGNVTDKITYGNSNYEGHAWTDNGYTHEFFTYDQAGQLLSRSRSSVPAGNGPAAPGPANRFIGRFGGSGGQEVLRRYVDLNAGVPRATIEFDILKLDSWDSESFTVFLNGGAAFTFRPESYGPGEDTGGGSFSTEGLTGTWTIISSGYDQSLGFSGWGDRPFRISMSVEGTGAVLALGLGSNTDESTDNESYGIDNVRIDQPAVVDDFENGAPAGWQFYGGAAPVSPGGKLSDGSLSKFVHGLGGSGGAEVLAKTYTLNGHIGHTTAEFEFLKLDSWDGEQLIVHLNGQVAFGFAPEGYGGGSDGASGTFALNGMSGTYTITSSGEDIGHRASPYWGERSYRVRIDIDGWQSSLRLGFGTTLDEGAANENFGIDNVRISQDAQVQDFQQGDFFGWWMYRTGAWAQTDYLPGTNTVGTPERETFVYDGLGRVIASTDLNGGRTSIVFKDAATKTVITLANGFVQTSTYNKAGGLVGFTESGDFVAAGTATYTYDLLGRVRTMTDASGFMSHFLYDKVGRKVADINHYGHVVEYRYDANDRLVATVRYTHPVDPGYFGAINDIQNNFDFAAIRPGGHPGDVWTWQVYDREGRTIESIDGDGGVTAYEYDASGQLIRTTVYATKLAQWQIDGFKGATPTQPVLPPASAADSVARNFYDSDGRLIGVLDGEGFVTKYTYDAAGQKVHQVTYAIASYEPFRASAAWWQVSANGPSAQDLETRYVYDGQGLLRFSIDGHLQVTEYVYQSGPTWTASGPVRQTIQYAGSIAALGSYTYASVRGAINAAGLAGHGGNRTSYAVYDAADRLVFSINAEGGVVGYSYDIMGQVTKTVVYAAARPTSWLPSKDDMHHWAYANDAHPENRITRSYYNDRGELRFSVDAEGYASRNDFDAEGRLTRTVRWDARVAVGDHDTIDTVSRKVGGATTETSTIYDAAGRVAAVFDGQGSSRHYAYYANGTLASDTVMLGHPDESRTQYEYNAAGRMTAEHRAWGTADQVTTRYGYDGFGNLISIQDPNGQVTTRAYDRAGRMVSETNAENGTTQIRYDAFGNVIRTIDARGNASWMYYDRLGRVTVSLDAEFYETQTAYNAFGDVVSVTRRYNRAHNGWYDYQRPATHAHHLDATTSFEYDRLGRVVRSIDAEGHFEQYRLDAFGQRVEVRNKIGGVTFNTYDRRGLLVAERLPMASVHRDGWVQAWDVTNRFEYDARGNRTRMIEADGLPERRTTRYAYDRADRLIETRGDAVQWVDHNAYNVQAWVEPVERILYDARGNVIETVDANGARTLFYYDKQNRKTEQVDGLGNMVSWRYDAAGNLTHERRWAVAANWAHSGNKGLPWVTGDDRVTNYTYDRLGRMTSSSIAAVRTGRWDGANYNVVDGDVTTRYDYDANGNLVRTTDANGGTVHSYYDRLGRKIREVDQEGHIVGWLLDAEGNAYHERRWAQKTGYAGLDGWWDPGVVAEDRVTDFTYDRNGRRLTETRRGVEAYNVNGWGGLDRTSSDSTISYDYNGLGQVTRKVEATAQGPDANQHDTLYTYDAAGRLITEARAHILNSDNQWVRPLVDYAYDGLNNLTRTTQTGRPYDGYTGQPSRVTRYGYTAGGRLHETIDSSGSVFTSWQDVAGNLVVQTWNRNRSDGSSVHEGVLYTRDILGRVTSQAVGSYAGGWTKGDVRHTQYNTFGDVSARGINGLQEQFGYNNAGRLSRSNSGDGVWRYYLHDGKGNQTLAIENEGRDDLVGRHINDALWIATAGNAYRVGQAYIDGVNATINVFDRRSQAVQTIQTKRQLSGDNQGATTDLSASRGYNAFGESTHEIDVRGFRTDFTYNTMGRNVSTQRDWVLITLENGAQQWVRPTETYFYDQSGRMVGVQDANTRRNTRVLLNGTGYGSNEALVAREHHADGGVVHYGYDVFGDERRTTDAIGRVTTRTYDALGRLNRVDHANGLVEGYLSDTLGQRIHTYDSFHNYHVTTDYDVQGRVVSAQAFGGDVTTTRYEYNGGLATWGMGWFGGWTETVTYANGMTSTSQSDIYGRELWKSDMGGHAFQLHYDQGGKLLHRYGPGETLSYTMLNTGLVGTVSNNNGNWAKYEYDQAGNRTWEFTVRAHAVVQDARAGYDKLGRLTSWSNYGNSVAGSASLTHDYDAVGNIRRTRSATPVLGQNGEYGGDQHSDHWYAFDAMNRVTTDKGTFGTRADGSTGIIRGTGTDYTWDAAGQRVTATRTTGASTQVRNPNYDPNMDREPNYDPWGNPRFETQPQINDEYMTVHYEADARETYGYDLGGALTTVHVATSSASDNGDGTVTVHPAVGLGAHKASFWNDALGRVTRQIDHGWNGAAYDRTVDYDAKGRIWHELTFTRQGNDTIRSETYNEYGANGNAALGAVTGATTYTRRNGDAQVTSRTDTSYQWWDGAVVSHVSHRPNTSQNTTFNTWYNYDAQGTLTSATIHDGRPRTVTFTNDMNGQVIRRDESDNNWSQGDPHEIWFRYGGREMGYSGNNGTTDTDYQRSVDMRTRAAPTTTTGAFRGGATSGSTYVDADPSIRKINSFEQGGSGGGYTVRGGDTLSGIAANLWGDASLWYKLAEINGLTANSALAEGTNLVIPAGVSKSTHNASTFKPYDPAEAIGETSPTNPKPQQAARKNKCGVFGAILLVAVAVDGDRRAMGAATGFFTTAFTGSAAAASAAAAAAATAGGVAGAKLPVRTRVAATGASAHAPSARTPGAAELPPTPPVPRSVCCWHC